MSLLWSQAMAWQVHEGEEGMSSGATHVKDAGFAGFVQHPRYEEATRRQREQGKNLNHKVWNESEPEPNDDDFHHFDEHFTFGPGHKQRHQEAYDSAMEHEHARDVPDHTDEALSHFQRNAGLLPSTWENKGTLGKVDLKSQPVFATQSHVNQVHVNRYKDKPDDKSWWEHRSGMDDPTGYKGTKHPCFVTHQGRLHVVEGHHRVAAALQRGDSEIHGWHYDLDKHPVDG